MVNKLLKDKSLLLLVIGGLIHLYLGGLVLFSSGFNLITNWFAGVQVVVGLVALFRLFMLYNKK